MLRRSWSSQMLVPAAVSAASRSLTAARLIPVSPSRSTSLSAAHTTPDPGWGLRRVEPAPLQAYGCPEVAVSLMPRRVPRKPDSALTTLYDDHAPALLAF